MPGTTHEALDIKYPIFHIRRLRLREDTSLLHGHVDWKLEIQNINSGRQTPKLPLYIYCSFFPSSPHPFLYHLEAAPLILWHNHLSSFTATKDPRGGCQSQACIFLDTMTGTDCARESERSSGIWALLSPSLMVKL